MAPRKDLAKIGQEGFYLIDQVYGKKSRQNSHEELEYHFKNHPQVQPCTYHKPENPVVTERLPIPPQPHYVIFRANDHVPMVSQPFHQTYPNPNQIPRQQPTAYHDFGQVHPGRGMAQDYGVMDSNRLAEMFRGVAKLEVRWVN